ncbi:FtsK/SpoIIIE domain-containing protein, partial [Kineococcus glutinatus]|uniref:FtsK/SpoIIIE domain-containing protein n=1 Tax=Kineococcus glutinatus TaxID=1070872 RepID=UPI0031F0852E
RVVTGGADAGRTALLGPGAHLLGRAPGPVRIADAGLSRHHVRVHVPAGGGPLEVEDAGSTNGSWLEDAGWRRELAGRGVLAGARLVVGDSTLQGDPPPAPPAASAPDGEGHVLVNRAPRLREAVQERALRLPAAPVAPVRAGPPWLAATVPLVLAVVTALLWSPLALLLGLAGPVLLLGQWWGDARAARRRHAVAEQGCEAERAAVLAEVSAALAAEHTRLHAAAPDAAAVLAVVRGPGLRLWERGGGDHDALELRVGTGDAPATTCTLDGVPPLLRGVPVTVRLGEVGVLGVSGPRRLVLGSARFLVGQVAAWHAPAAVALVVVSAAHEEEAAADWGWAAWLPHARAPLGPGPDQVATRTTGLAGAAEVVQELRAVLAARGPGGRSRVAAVPRVVVVLDGAAALRSVPGVADVLREGPAAGVCVVCLDEDAARLPPECAAVLEVDGTGGEAPDGTPEGGARLRVSGQEVRSVRVDGVEAWWAQACARALAPLRDATPSAATAVLPRTCHLVDLLRHVPFAVDPLDAASVAARWASPPPAPVVPLGDDGAGPLLVDLAADGPHALVAGTTGAGKSELLQTLVAGLAATHPPDRLQFVLVDYKGGSAFAECATLPHCAGLVTDLDEHLGRRALRSLSAEVRRRERLLRAAGARDLAELHARTDPSSLARLVVVVDEFRVLAEELPDFVGGLVRLAAVGRSLGVHLVLATQRPAGVVSADIRANTNLRIALRVQDRADAEDVVGSPAPALLDERVPGRAVLRTGGRLTTLQVARVAASAPRTPTAAPPGELAGGA